MKAIDWDNVNLGGQANLIPKQANPATVFGAFEVDPIVWTKNGSSLDREAG
jgi:hypothetical protein